jgi:quercetin dioxygenase-like cupin family protein
MQSARPRARPTLIVDNERAIVTEWRFAPGAETGWHRHGHDYVVVPMTTGKLLLEEPGGTSRTAELTAGKPYFRAEGVEHNVVNASDCEFVFIEIEMKR